jgi:replicative DNA helicase
VPAFFTSSEASNLYDLAETLRGDSPHFLIVIDSLHSWADKDTAGGTEYEYLNKAISQLISLAASLNCPIMAVTEMPKGQVESGGVMGGAGTRKIGYGGQSVMELKRDTSAGKSDPNGERSISLKFSKNRDGDDGRPVELKFHGGLMRFREV